MPKDKIFDLVEKEKKRQENTLMMIPSENYTYPEVMAAVGSVLMQKYAEGCVGKRYYQGNKIIDEIEALCQRRALDAFGLDNDWKCNVQPHSGCEANLAVYNALLEPGDKILAMYLPDGGHLSHGWHIGEKKVTLVSKIYKVEFYKVDPKTEVFDYDEVEKQAVRFGPKLIISGGTAYPREIDYKRMGEIAKKVGAYYLADVAHEAGLIAGGACQSPFEWADVVTMTTHKTLRGPRGALIFGKSELMDKINASLFPGLQGGPHIHTIAGIAVALEKTKTKEFKDYARQTVKNARKLAAVLIGGGLKVISGGTDKHLVLVDVGFERGREVAERLEQVGIIVNKNTIPGEKGSPFKPSGIRVGTQALTVRGMKEEGMEEIGEIIINTIMNNELQITNNERIKNLCQRFPAS